MNWNVNLNIQVVARQTKATMIFVRVWDYDIFMKYVVMLERVTKLMPIFHADVMKVLNRFYIDISQLESSARTDETRN